MPQRPSGFKAETAQPCGKHRSTGVRLLLSQPGHRDKTLSLFSGPGRLRAKEFLSRVQEAKQSTPSSSPVPRNSEDAHPSLRVTETPVTGIPQHKLFCLWPLPFSRLLRRVRVAGHTRTWAPAPLHRIPAYERVGVYPLTRQWTFWVGFSLPFFLVSEPL